MTWDLVTVFALNDFFLQVAGGVGVGVNFFFFPTNMAYKLINEHLFSRIFGMSQGRTQNLGRQRINS